MIFAAGALVGAAVASTAARHSLTLCLARSNREPRAARGGYATSRQSDEPVFEEAISKDEFERRRRKATPEPTVEEVRDEDGLTAAEAREKFRREHPEEFAEAEARRERRQTARSEARANRQNFIDQVDPSLLAENERKAHSAYANALADANTLRESIREARAAGEAVPEETLAAFREAQRTLREGAAAERKALFAAAARSIGLEESSVPEFTAVLNDIIEATK